MKASTKLLTFPLLTALLTFAACNQESNQTQPVTTMTNTGTSTAPPASEVKARNNALVRVLHTVPGVAATDLFSGDTKAFANVTYKSITPYQELPSARQMIRLRLAGQDAAQPLIEDSQAFTGGAHYTVIALPSSFGKAALKTTEDNLKPPANGKAKARLIHASPDIGEVDVYLAGRAEALLESVNSSSVSDYEQVDPFSGTIEVRREGENVATLEVPNAQLQAGKIYTIVIVGQVKGTTKLEAVVIEDQLGGGTTP